MAVVECVGAGSIKLQKALVLPVILQLRDVKLAPSHSMTSSCSLQCPVEENYNPLDDDQSDRCIFCGGR